LRPEGRHVVTLTANGDLGSIAPDFVWRTLANMGLIDGGAPARRASAAR